METRIIHCNKKEKIILTSEEKSNGLVIALVDEGGVPIARYSFDVEKLKYLDSITYLSDNVRVSFGGITPSMLYEFSSSQFT